MGILRECKVRQLSDGTIFEGHCWTQGNGILEAFWYENGNRVTQFFHPNGRPIGFFNKYTLSF